MEKPLKFKCPRCGCDTIEEILQDVVLGYKLTGLDEDGELAYFVGPPTIYEGQVSHYQCDGCGFALKTDSADAEGLAEYLLEQEVNQNDEVRRS